MYLKEIWNCFRGTIGETSDRQGGLPNTGFSKQSNDQWNCLNVGGTSQRQGGMHMGFSVHTDTTLNRRAP